MKFKCLAAAVSLCFPLASLSAQAELVTGHHSHETTRLASPADSSQDPGNTDGQDALNLLDVAWILGLTTAGLVLLRKVQGD